MNKRKIMRELQTITTSLEQDINEIINDRISEVIQEETQKLSKQYFREIDVHFVAKIK